MGCGTSSPTNSFTPEANPRNNSRNGTSVAGGQSAAFGAAPTIVARPLVKAKNYRQGEQITQGELTNQRADFWSSRTEGNSVMWQIIRSAAEAVLADDLGLANAILEASLITTPNGSLEVCYDERGVQYKVPVYCYANPVELTNEPLPTSSSSNGSSSGLPSEQVRGAPVKLRVRINPGDINVIIDANTGHTVSDLKHLVVEHARRANLPVEGLDHDRQRVIFMGKEMANKTKLSDTTVDDSKVVQIFLRPRAK